MSDHLWLRSDDPLSMLTVIGGRREIGAAHGRCTPMTSPRKLRLIACACERSWWERSGPEDMDWRTQRSIEVAESLADGLVSASADQVIRLRDGGNHWLRENVWEAVQSVLVTHDTIGDGQPFADIIRDVVNNPYRPFLLDFSQDCQDSSCPRPKPSGRPAARGTTCVACDRPWICRWLTTEVQNMARYAYRFRDFSALPAIADALEEAGCPPSVPCAWCKGKGKEIVRRPKPPEPFKRSFVAEYETAEVFCCGCQGAGIYLSPLLAHLRGVRSYCDQPTRHWKGCWALDLLLGKE